MNELTKQEIELALDESEEEYINNTKEEWTPTGVRDAKVEGVLKVVRLAVEELKKRGKKRKWTNCSTGKIYYTLDVKESDFDDVFSGVKDDESL